MIKMKKILVSVGMASVLLLAACGNENDEKAKEGKKEAVHKKEEPKKLNLVKDKIETEKIKNEEGKYITFVKYSGTMKNNTQKNLKIEEIAYHIVDKNDNTVHIASFNEVEQAYIMKGEKYNFYQVIDTNKFDKDSKVKIFVKTKELKDDEKIEQKRLKVEFSELKIKENSAIVEAKINTTKVKVEDMTANLFVKNKNGQIIQKVDVIVRNDHMKDQKIIQEISLKEKEIKQLEKGYKLEGIVFYNLKEKNDAVKQEKNNNEVKQEKENKE